MQVEDFRRGLTYGNFATFSNSSDQFNRIKIGPYGQKSSDNSNPFEFVIGQPSQSPQSYSTTSNVTTFKNKLALSYKLNDMAAFINGIKQTPFDDTNSILPVGINRLYLGGVTNYIQSFYYYKKKLSDAKISQLTK